jgi:hypothetical protein
MLVVVLAFGTQSCDVFKLELLQNQADRSLTIGL